MGRREAPDVLPEHFSCPIGTFVGRVSHSPCVAVCLDIVWGMAGMDSYQPFECFIQERIRRCWRCWSGARGEIVGHLVSPPNRLRKNSVFAQYATINSCVVSASAYPAGCAKR